MLRLRRLHAGLYMFAGLLVLIFAAYHTEAQAQFEANAEPDGQAPEALPLTDEANSEAEPLELCYLSVEYRGEEMSRTLVLVMVDATEAKILQTGDRIVKRYAEGEHRVTVRRPKGGRKPSDKNTFSVELEPFRYTKILIEEIKDIKKPTVNVMILEDGSVKREKRIKL